MSNDCKRYRELFVEAAYGELAETVSRDLKKHLRNCANCQKEYGEISATLEMMDKRKHPKIDEEYWNQLENRILDKTLGGPGEAKKAISFFGRRKVRFLYPVAATVLILFGIFLGKTFFTPQDFNQSAPAELLNASVSRYFSNVKPLLLECANYDHESSGQVLISKESLKMLLMQNYLLKKAIKNSNDIQLIQLVEDLELILIEVSNRNPENPRALQAVQKQIVDQDILFKIGSFTKKRTPAM